MKLVFTRNCMDIIAIRERNASRKGHHLYTRNKRTYLRLNVVLHLVTVCPVQQPEHYIAPPCPRAESLWISCPHKIVVSKGKACFCGLLLVPPVATASPDQRMTDGLGNKWPSRVTETVPAFCWMKSRRLVSRGGGGDSRKWIQSVTTAHICSVNREHACVHKVPRLCKHLRTQYLSVTNNTFT
jgi:hypothetical protein